MDDLKASDYLKASEEYELLNYTQKTNETIPIEEFQVSGKQLNLKNKKNKNKTADFRKDAEVDSRKDL